MATLLQLESLDGIPPIYRVAVAAQMGRRRTMQEILDGVIDAGLYTSETYNKSMITAIATAESIGVVSHSERIMAINNIADWLAPACVLTLPEALANHNLPFDYDTCLGIYRNWAFRPIFKLSDADKRRVYEYAVDIASEASLKEFPTVCGELIINHYAAGFNDHEFLIDALLESSRRADSKSDHKEFITRIAKYSDG